MKSSTLLLSLVFSFTLAACGQDKSEEAAMPPADVATAEAPAVEAAPVATEAAEPSTDAAGESVDASSLYASKCASCHGEMAEGVAGNPKLAGLTKADISAKLTDYRAGKQMGPKTAIMAGMAKPLTDAQIAALGQYLGN